MSLHTLAENLGMTVTRIKQEMPMSELNNWFQYYEQRNEKKERQEEAAKGNLLALEPDQLATMFGGDNGSAD